jgi:membrane protein implicated in regulation of membrane protease activity
VAHQYPIRRISCWVALLTAALSAGRAHASLLLSTPDCSAAANSLQCRLTGVLSFLYIAGVLLAVLLLLVIVLAVRSYRRASRNTDKDRP